jgi:hypothetical protein
MKQNLRIYHVHPSYVVRVGSDKTQLISKLQKLEEGILYVWRLALERLCDTEQIVL